MNTNDVTEYKIGLLYKFLILVFQYLHYNCITDTLGKCNKITHGIELIRDLYHSI